LDYFFIQRGSELDGVWVNTNRNLNHIPEIEFRGRRFVATSSQGHFQEGVF